MASQNPHLCCVESTHIIWLLWSRTGHPGYPSNQYISGKMGLGTSILQESKVWVPANCMKDGSGYLRTSFSTP